MTPLFRLMFVQFRAMARRMLRGATTPRRLLMFALGACVVLLWILPNLLFTHRLPPSDPRRIELAAPFALLGICVLTLVTSAGDRAISFTPGEVDLLFPGPFTRRQLIAYKLIKSAAAAGMTALVLSWLLRRHASWWLARYVGVFLALLFVQYFSINSVIIVQTLGAAFRSRLRYAVLLFIGVTAVFIARPAMNAGMPLNSKDLMERVDAAPLGHALLAPFAVFGRIMTASSGTRLASEATGGAVIDLLLMGLIAYLDSWYLEAATAASARRSAQLQRIRGGSMLSMSVGATAGWQLPKLPWLAGAGPITWRQLTSVARSSRGLLFLLLILAIGSAPLLSTGSKAANFGTTFATVIVWLTLLVSTMLKFDFRGDLDLMDLLKSLPLRPWAIAAGQLVAPTLLMTATHLVLLTVACRSLPQYRHGFFAAAVLALPLNLLLFEIENLLFLLFPSRPAAASPGDFQVLGRQAIVLAGKMFALVLLAAPPLGIGLFISVLAGKSLVAFTIVALLLLLAENVGLIRLIGWAFARFDPSTQTPA